MTPNPALDDDPGIQHLRERLVALNKQMADLLGVDPATGQAVLDGEGKAAQVDWTDERRSKYDAAMAEAAGVKSQIRAKAAYIEHLAEAAGERRSEDLRRGGDFAERAGAEALDDVFARGHGARLAKAALGFSARVRSALAGRLEREHGWTPDRAAAEAEAAMDAYEHALVRGEAALAAHSQATGREFSNILLTGQTTAPKGGIATPPEVSAALWEMMKHYLPYSDYVTVMPVTHGRKVSEPYTDDTANEGEFLDENDAIGAKDIALGEVAIQPCRISSREVLVSWTWIESQLLSNAVARIYALLAIRLARTVSRMTLLGQATKTPNQIGIHGAVTAASGGGKKVVSKSATAVGVDDIQAVYRGASSIYRPRSTFVMADSTIGELENIALGSNDARRLFTPDLQAAGLMRFRGRPIIEDNNVDAVPAAAGANHETMFFGPLENVVLKPWTGSAMTFRWQDERAYSGKNQIGFAQCEYWGVGVLFAGAFAYLIQKAS